MTLQERLQRQPTMGSLFAGIGGFDLGFERAGFKTSWQVERDEFCRKVLAKNFPHADRSVIDVREAGQRNLSWVDVVCAGFPCQDISNAGLGAGIEGERSGLITEAVRIIRELRPKFVVLENTASLLERGMGAVIGYLAAIGYDAEWEVIPAAAIGARHIRERLFIVAYPDSMDNAYSFDQGSFRGQAPTYRRWAENAPIGSCFGGGTWTREPAVARVAYGIRGRLDRLRGLGNAVVPQIPEMIARRIKQALEAA